MNKKVNITTFFLKVIPNNEQGFWGNVKKLRPLWLLYLGNTINCLSTVTAEYRYLPLVNQ